MNDDDWLTATNVLRLSTQLVDGIQDGMAERGFADVRPIHGFVFAVLSRQPVTASMLAIELDITKQAAAQLISHLVGCGYLQRTADPSDGRAQLVSLTERGRSATHAARKAAESYVDTWREQLPVDDLDAFVATLGTLSTPGRLRPNWRAIN